VRKRSITDITFSWPRFHMAAIGLTPSGTMVTEDIRNLQSWAEHEDEDPSPDRLDRER
jgi:hypothetical protein